jgi:hypothetical protein
MGLAMTSPALIVLYEVTQDNCDGAPWPPDGKDFWSVVARRYGSTIWRRITLAQQPIFQPSLAPMARKQISAPRREDHE